MSFGSTKEFYSIINQNYLEPETDHRSRFKDTDIEVPSAWVRFFFAYVYVMFVVLVQFDFPNNITRFGDLKTITYAGLGFIGIAQKCSRPIHQGNGRCKMNNNAT